MPTDSLFGLFPGKPDFVLSDDDECFLPVHTMDEQQERCECLVYIDEINVAAEYRGQNIGTTLFSHIGRILNMENCLIGLFAFPIAKQPDEKRSIIDINRVKNFYQKLGFLHAGHEFMVKNARNCEAIRKRLAYRNQPMRSH